MEFDWQILIHPPLEGGVNMAVDWWLLRNVEKPTIRFYAWEQPTLSLGYRQQFDPPDSLPAGLDSIPTVVRPTGGGYLLHADEITYALVYPAGHPFTEKSILDSYEALLGSLERTLLEEGILARSSRGEGSAAGEDCLASPACHEPVAEGKKWTACSQTRHRRALLQHGSLFWGEAGWLPSKDLERPLFLKPRSEGGRDVLRSRLLAGLARDLFPGQTARTLEIEPGHGRRTETLAERFRVPGRGDLPRFRRHSGGSGGLRAP